GKPAIAGSLSPSNRLVTSAATRPCSETNREPCTPSTSTLKRPTPNAGGYWPCCASRSPSSASTTPSSTWRCHRSSSTCTPKERARAIGVWAGVSGLGVAIGPLAGGLLLEHFWWGSVFLVNVPICLTAIIAGRFVVPTTPKDPDEALDPLGALLSIVGLVGFLYAIIEVPDKGWTAPAVVIPGLVGVAFLTLFGVWEVKSRHPMLDLHFFANPRFSAASATITLTFFAL